MWVWGREWDLHAGKIKKNTTTPCAQREWDALLISKGHEDIPRLVPCLEGRGAAADGNPAPARDTSHPTAEPKAL